MVIYIGDASAVQKLRDTCVNWILLVLKISCTHSGRTKLFFEICKELASLDSFTKGLQCNNLT